MKQINILVFSLLTGLTLAASAQNGGEIPVPLTDATKRGKLNVDIKYGTITIKGSARKDVLVRYKSEETNEPEPKSKEGLKRISSGSVDIEIAENNNLVRVESGSWSKKTNVEIEVPNNFDLHVQGYNESDIRIANIQGELELETHNGEITADNISGSVVANTYNGDIKVAFDKVTENTPMSFTTFNGDVDLSFPASLKATLKMKTDQGDIYTGFDVSLSKSGPVQKKDTKSGTFKVVVDEWTKGDINGGGPEMTMKTYQGDVLVRKR